jgi:predicted PurR-regulated permease PerM
MIDQSKGIVRFKHAQDALVILLILYFGRGLFVPLSFALLISFILYPICCWLERKKLSRVAAIAISLSVLMLLSLALVYVLLTQLFSFMAEWPRLKSQLMDSFSALSVYVTDQFDVSQLEQKQWLTNFLNNSGGDAIQLIQRTVSASAVSLVLAVLIPIYAYLILYYRHRLVDALYYLFPEEGRENLREILRQSIGSYYNFIKGMAIVYLIVGALNSLGLFLLGIPHALLFGYITSVLTIIPYIGIMIGALLPISVAWVTYQSALYPLGVVIVFSVVQYLEANVIFPWAVSDRLKINTLVTIVVIIGGGIIWGAAGMILFIPFLGILKLIADRNQKMKFWSLLLGTDS